MKIKERSPKIELVNYKKITSELLKSPTARGKELKESFVSGGVSLSSLINSFAQSAESTNTNLTTQGLTRAYNTLTGQKLRYFVYRSSGYGNQANTVNLMKRMIALGFTNQIELIYDNSPDSDVINKLAVLLPGLDPTNPQPYTLDSVTINFFPYTESSNGDTVTRSVAGLSGTTPLCINGGAEINSITNENLANALKVDFYLQLQPYMWEIVNTTDHPISLILQKDATEIVDLLTQNTLQCETFAYRAFAMSIPTEPDWSQLLEIPNINVDMIQRAKALCDAVKASKAMSQPMYGLYDAPFARKPVLGDASDMAFELIAAAALAQKSGSPFNQPIVISLLNTLQDTTWETLSNYFPKYGVSLPDEETSDMDQDEKISYFVRRWSASQNLFQKGTGGTANIYIERDISASDLSSLIGSLGDTGVIVIGLPSMPQDLFNYLYESAALPSVFEGQGTANLALNLGKPFFKLAKTGVNPYPSTLGNSSSEAESTASTISAELYDATFNLIQLGTYQFKSGFSGDMPPTLLSQLLINLANDYSSKGPYWQYFDGLKSFYANIANDKLLQGLVFLVTKYDLGNSGEMSHSLRSLADTAQINDDKTPIEQLYQQIENAISDGILTLIPTVIPNGPFADFVTAIIEGSDFQIGTASTPVQVIYPATHDKITVIGRTTDFLGTSLTVTVEFTMNANANSIDTAMDLTVGEISFSGVEWFNLQSVKISSTVPGNDGRLTGSIATTINLGDKPFSFSADFPSSAEGKVVIDGDLSKNSPSLNDLFQFLGGMNFMNTMPAQISNAGNIELTKIKFGYDYTSKAIDTFELTLVNAQTWPLFGKLSLENLDFTISLMEPTGSRIIGWTASTTVDIGSGSIDTSVTYPNLTVSASLTEGSTIPLGDLFTFFLPANYTINLSANLGNFSMNVTPGEKGAETVYSLSAGVDMENWDLTLSVATFSLSNIFMNIEGVGTDLSEASGTFAASTVLFSDQPNIAVTMNLTAIYSGNGEWSFVGAQGNSAIKVKQIIETYLGSGWWVTGMPDLDISELLMKVESSNGEDNKAAKSYMVGGTITVWDTPLGDDFQSIITGQFGNGPKSSTTIAAKDATQIMPAILADLSEVALTDNDTSYGEVSAKIIWKNIEVDVFYNYAKDYNSYGFKWGDLTAKIDNQSETATLTFSGSTSVGSMVEMFISWLTGSKYGLAAPWNLLDKITLSNFTLIWTFKSNEESVKFSVNIGPINLIFAEVKGFSLEYVPTGGTKDPGVNVSLDGSFPWLAEENKSTDSLGWNAADPSSTPAPPGSGNKYLDLRLLAAGQHVQVNGLSTITSVDEAIKLLAQLPVPSGDTIPAIGFDAGNNWLFATDFGVLKIESSDKSGGTKALASSTSGYVFTLQVVFTDPTLYALRIALEGDAAKVFAGLDFQIIYRELSQGLGVFSAEITLPTIMRRIDVGAVTITLPTFGVEVYTSGDFKFDIGFPWNENFARSFSVEAIVPPGIPVLGSGGFYFGKLPAVAVTQLPVATNGFFNPNLIFGFGAQMGLGKSIEAGILKAGFSLTVFGILEGIIAKWNPYNGTSTGGGSELSLQGEYYFWLQGTFGILGHLYGSIDFVIIKATVDVNLKIYAQITLASYEPIPISVHVSVDVSAKVKINLGLFSISLSLRFSTQINQTFTLGAIQNPADAPWITAKSGDGGRILAPHTERLQLRAFSFAEGLMSGSEIQPNWDNLLSGLNPSDPPLNAYLGYGLSIAGDEAFDSVSPDLSKQFPTYIASLFIEAPGAATSGDRTNAQRAVGSSSDTAFESLAKMVTRWAVSSVQAKAMTPSEIDELVVSVNTLNELINYLSDAENVPIPLSAADIETFMIKQFVMKVSMPTDEGSAEATYFPMALELNIDMPAYGSNPAINYNFDEYNSVGTDFVSFLRDYFNQLAVQVEAESGDGAKLTNVFTNDAISIANFIFSDYFVLVMRQMLQAMLDGLRDFNYELQSGDTGNTIVTWVNTTGALESINQVFTLYDLFKGNESKTLTVGKIIQLPLVSYTIAAGDSFTSIAAIDTYGGDFSATTLATNNADMAGLLNAGQQITYNNIAYVISGDESLNAFANGINVSLADLLAGSDIITSTDILSASAQLTVPPYHHSIVAGDSLQSLATGNGITVQDLAGVTVNDVTSPIGTANGDIADLFDSTSSPDIDLVYLPQFQVGALIAEVQRVGAINNLSGMASRYYFHGMRLPTSKITPNKEGMWVTKDSQGNLSLPDYAGLFALTGQQLPFTSLPTEPLKITISKEDSLTWMTFENGSNEIVYTLTPPAGEAPGDTDYLRISSLDTYAKSTILPAGPKELITRATVEDEPARYPLSSGIDWQSTAAISFPNGGSSLNEQPRLWPLPNAMLALSDVGDLSQSELLSDTSPNFTLQTLQMDAATGEVRTVNISQYGWASSIEFTVKKLPASSTASDAYNATYEISGASANDAVILERIVQYVDEDSAFASLAVGYQTTSSSAGQNLAAEVGSNVSFGISQVNLSTVTRPPSAFTALSLAEEDSDTNLLNAPTELVRLLWEASITRSGGFFLYYYDANTRSGLPDAAFNDKGEATLTLVIMYENQPRLQPYMNAVATGDPIDISSSTLVSEAIRNSASYTVASEDTLASIVARYYSNLVSVVDNSAAIALETSSTLSVNNGVYQVPLDGTAPGGDLADIAAYFGISADEIKTANPRVPDSDWTNGLPLGAAIRLPVTTVTSADGDTLTSIATKYGTSAVVLAGHNASVSPLLKTGQILNMMTGPLAQHGSQAAGVQPMFATRNGLPEVPSNPTDKDFAEDFLLNDYTLLAYQVEANFDFDASNIGLPLGQQGESSSESIGKVRYAREFNSSDPLNYSTSIPYVQFAIDPADADNSYTANGRILQTVYNWNDLYGNRMVSNLDDSSTSASANNNTPSLTGYTDKILGTAQWPSTSTSWTVASSGDNASSEFKLEVTSVFDPSAFNPSTGDTTNAWIARAQSSLMSINQILAQINDPNGMAFTVDCTLVSDSLPIASNQIGTGADYGKSGTLTGWWVPIQTFLIARAAGNSTTPDPTNLSFTLTASAPLANVTTDEVFLLTLYLKIERTNGVAEGDYAAIANVKTISCLIPTKTNAGDNSQSGNENVLLDFAQDIQDTLSVEGKYSLTVASGTNRFAASATSSQTAVWGVRLGAPGSDEGISFTVNDASTPELYAPEPVSNTLLTKNATVYPYSQLSDYDPTTNSFTSAVKTNAYTGVDADSWIRQFFTFFDTLLSPEYTSSILVVDAKATNKPSGIDSFLDAFAAQKEILADITSKLMGPVYQRQTSTRRLASAQETFRQNLLQQLSHLYTTQAAISFGASVVADIKEDSEELTPQLFGNVNWTVDDQNIESLVTLSSPKMPLATAEDQPITFLLEAPERLTVNGQVVEEVKLALSFQGSAIEHQIANVPGIEGYVASSWLSPIQTGADAPLAGDLGSFTVPLLLRTFPDTPRMNTQTGVATNPDASELNDLTQWTYSFTYSLDFHYEQDRVYTEVSYNIADNNDTMLASLLDAFQGLAQLITYQDNLTNIINANVPSVDATTTDQTAINNASLALGAALKMVTDIATQASQAGSMQMINPANRLAGSETYNFYIEEASKTFTGDDGSIKAWVVNLVSTDKVPPTGLTAYPSVNIDEYTRIYIPNLSIPEQGNYAYYYVNSKGDPLTGADAQALAARQVELPGMQILARQDAISEVHLTRNENIGGEINEPFVYTTPEVSFGNPLHPTISTSQQIPIANLGSSDNTPITRSFDAHLTALFNALFQNSFQGDSTIQINAGYTYSFNEELTDMSVPIPVAIMPPLSVKIGSEGSSETTLTEMVTTVSAAITKWANMYGPSKLDASLLFQLTIMSNLTQDPMPLLGLKDLVLDVQYIYPPLS